MARSTRTLYRFSASLMLDHCAPVVTPRRKPAARCPAFWRQNHTRKPRSARHHWRSAQRRRSSRHRAGTTFTVAKSRSVPMSQGPCRWPRHRCGYARHLNLPAPARTSLRSRRCSPSGRTSCRRSFPEQAPYLLQEDSRHAPKEIAAFFDEHVVRRANPKMRLDSRFLEVRAADFFPAAFNSSVERPNSTIGSIVGNQRRFSGLALSFRSGRLRRKRTRWRMRLIRAHRVLKILN
jgi:hypothetical protein